MPSSRVPLLQTLHDYVPSIFIPSLFLPLYLLLCQTILQNTEDLGPLTNEATYGVTALAWGDAHKLQRALYPHGKATSSFRLDAASRLPFFARPSSSVSCKCSVGARHHRASTKQSLEDELISEESSIEDSEDAAATPGEYDWQGVPTGTRFNVEDWVVAATVEGKLAVFAYDGKYLGSIVTGEVIRCVTKQTLMYTSTVLTRLVYVAPLACIHVSQPTAAGLWPWTPGACLPSRAAPGGWCACGI